MKIIAALIALLIVAAAAVGIVVYYSPSTSKFQFQEPAYDAASLPRLSAGETLDFTNGLNRSAMLSGWSGPEPQGVWSDGHAAYLGFVIDKGQGSLPENLVLRAVPFLVPEKLTEQKVEVWSQGKKIGDYALHANKSEITLPLSNLSISDGAPLILGLYLPNANSPKDLQGKSDPRQLAVWLSAVQAP